MIFRKLSFLVLILVVSISSFAVTYKYNLKKDDKVIGQIISQIDEQKFIGDTLTTFIDPVSKKTVKYFASTSYFKDWSLKTYKLVISEDGREIGNFYCQSDGKNIRNYFNSLILKSYTEPNAKIFDNNFIIDHYYALIKGKVSGNFRVFVPYQTFFKTTEANAIADTSLSQGNINYTITIDSIEQKIRVISNYIYTVQIPSKNMMLELVSVDDVPASNIIPPYEEDSVNIDQVAGFFTVPLVLKSKTTAFLFFNYPEPSMDFTESSTTITATVVDNPNKEKNKKLFDTLAKSFTEKGFITFRYGKNTVKEGYEIPASDFISDLKKAIDYLKKTPEIKDIYLIARGYGGMFTQAFTQIPEIKGIIYLNPELLRLTQHLEKTLEFQTDFYTEDIERANLLMKAKEIVQAMNNDLFTNPDAPSTYFKIPYKLLKQFDDMSSNSIEELIKTDKKILILTGKADTICPYKPVKDFEVFLTTNPGLKIEYLEDTNHEMIIKDIINPAVYDNIFKFVQ